MNIILTSVILFITCLVLFFLCFFGFFTAYFRIRYETNKKYKKTQNLQVFSVLGLAVLFILLLFLKDVIHSVILSIIISCAFFFSLVAAGFAGEKTGSKRYRKKN